MVGMAEEVRPVATRNGNSKDGRMHLDRMRRNVAFMERVMKGSLNMKKVTKDEIKTIREVFGNLLSGFFPLTMDQKKKLRSKESMIIKCYKSSKACKRSSSTIVAVFKLIGGPLQKLLQSL